MTSALDFRLHKFFLQSAARACGRCCVLRRPVLRWLVYRVPRRALLRLSGLVCSAEDLELPWPVIVRDV